MQKPDLAQIIRVNQAGEFGAVRIYQGQIQALRYTSYATTLEHMLEQEKAHLALFNEQLVSRKIRPTILSPLWSVTGFVLGYVTAKIDPKIAMACTVCVEEVIAAHYKQQESILEDGDLKQIITQCRQEEEEHHDIGIEHDALQAPGFRVFSPLIKAGTRLAIALSKRI